MLDLRLPTGRPVQALLDKAQQEGQKLDAGATLGPAGWGHRALGGMMAGRSRPPPRAAERLALSPLQGAVAQAGREQAQQPLVMGGARASEEARARTSKRYTPLCTACLRTRTLALGSRCAMPMQIFPLVVDREPWAHTTT